MSPSVSSGSPSTLLSLRRHRASRGGEGAETPRFVATLGACLHLVVPALVVVVALVCHLLHNPIPLWPLVVLLSGAYGKAVLHELLQSAVATRLVDVRDPSHLLPLEHPEGER